jgi:5-(carboxyamino)imidazole ribonucleotide synthase
MIYPQYSGKRNLVGILGGGQLGRMLALAGYPLGLRFRFLEPAPDSPGGHLAEQIVAPYDDPEGLRRFTAGLTVATYEFENVSVAAAHHISSRTNLYPPPAALAASQERLVEKTLFHKLEIPVPSFYAVDSPDGLKTAVDKMGLPCVLKTRRFGYDGKGQKVLRTEEDVDMAWDELGGKPLILERFVSFDREVSLIAVRSKTGEMAFYPLVENHHREGILRLSLAPAPDLLPTLQAQAELFANKILQELEYVGVLAIEFFQQGDRLLANEMAPRVHNSGHWTIEGAETSQFENHLRAIMGMPLGSTRLVGISAMVNLIGTLPNIESVLKIPGAHLHLYGKEPRLGRKIGHVTIRTDSEADLQVRLAEMHDLMESESSAA